jgi:hypothetical protein
MSWTPHAPWVVDWNAITTTVRTGDGQAVARTYRGDADARKIAAVPLLLNALHEAGDVTAAHLAHGEVSRGGWQCLMGQILAALAEGGDL